MKIINGERFYAFDLSDRQIAVHLAALGKLPLEQALDVYLDLQKQIAAHRGASQPQPSPAAPPT
jgi:hypothetical protein